LPADAARENPAAHIGIVGKAPDRAICRYAKVLKTVAYLVTDEDECGEPVVERWDIKKFRSYI